jgi:diguanylate cyclase (GGDEF)-like protein
VSDNSGGRVRGSASRGTTASRLTTLGLAAIFCLIAGVSLFRANAGENKIEQGRNSESISRAYEDARFAVAAEDFWVTEALLKFGPEAKTVDLGEARRRHGSATKGLDFALRRVTRLGGSADDAIAARLRAHHRRYVRAADALFAAISAGSSARAFAIEVEQIDRLFPSIESTVRRASGSHEREAARAFADIETSNETTIATLVAVIPIGLVLLVLLARTLHASRRREERAKADVTRLELDRLQHMALSDSLTGLKNHRAFHEDLERDLKRRERDDSSLALVMLDLDGLKATNDSQGHEAGDRKLRELASGLLEALRTSDAAYRIGGDEFAVILAGTDALGARPLILRLQELLAKSASGTRATAGVAEATSGMTREQLVREADLALIEAKRNRVPAMPPPSDGDALHQGSPLS